MSFLELNWLARADKYIPLPVVVFAPLDVGGYFIAPCRDEYLVKNTYYSLDRGLIAVNESDPNPSGTLAHEWRHLWQLYNWGKRGFYAQWNNESRLSYKQQIINFFTSDIRELDALLFERKKADCEYAEQWHEWIIKHKGANHVSA